MLRLVTKLIIVLSKAAATRNEDVIVGEVKSAVKELIANELMEIVEESLDDILRTSVQNTQGGIQSFLYNVVEQVML